MCHSSLNLKWNCIKIRWFFTKLLTKISWLLLWLTVCTFSGAVCPLTEFCKVQNLLCVQVLRSSILAALLHGTPVVSVSQTLRHWAAGATYIRQVGHHVGHGLTFYTVSQKKFSPFNCLWLCQILTGVQNFCTAGNRMKFATKPIQHYRPHLRLVATLDWELKNSNFLQMWKKTQSNCIFNHL